MNHDLQRQLVHRVLAHLAQRTTDTGEAPTALPVSAYADDARFEREHARLFRQLPLAVGHISQLAAPGDFFTHDATGVPLLITRGDDGELAAFLNVCRHRGTRVEPAACGARKAFVCPYHAWSYGRDGSLLGMPHERGFAGLDRSQHGLVRVPVAEAAGLVFVVPTPGATLDLASWLGPLTDDLAGFGLATSHVYAPAVETRALSWKLGIDVFLEAYHLRPTHQDTIYGMFFDNLGLVDPVGPHLRNVFPKRTIRELANQPETGWELRRHANVLFHLFPSTLVLVEPDHAAVLHLWPQGPTRCLLTSYLLVPEPAVTDKAKAYWDANHRVLMEAVREDFAMGESIQRGLTSGANREVTFGAFEHALAHFHVQIERLATPHPVDDRA
jgi:phenylpropionate dioxygenase-like ring-hydroxylating dioxygenase large terminal subunit